MSVYYPQGVAVLRVMWEDFGQKSDARFKQAYTVALTCKTLRVNINDYAQADTFDATIDYRNFPFDPRLIRACGITIHIEDREKMFDSENALNLIGLKSENVVFQGFVDTEKIQLNEEDQTVQIEGRDFTSILIDTPYLGEPIPLTESLDSILSRILKELPATEKIILDNRTGTTLPTLAAFAPDFGKQGGSKNVRRDESYWDVIQDLVSRAGLIAFISLDKLVLTKPRNLYSPNKAKIFVYGRNVKTLDFERKLGRQKGFNVRVVSLNIAEKRLEEAKIPEEATLEWCRDIGILRKPVTIPKLDSQGQPIADDKSTAPYTTIRIADVTSKDQLIAIGEKVFEELGRQQIEGNLETNEMKVLERDNQTRFDLTKLEIGTPLQIEIENSDLQKMKRISSRNDKIQFLRNQGYDANVSTIVADTFKRVDTLFFTKEVEMSLDQENGFSVKVGFINFIQLPKDLAN